MKKVAPIFVQFSSKNVARKVFKAKSKLTSAGVFASESLGTLRRDILNAAKDKYGKRNAWVDHVQILTKPIRSISDCILISDVMISVFCICCCWFLLLFYFFVAFPFFFYACFFFFTGNRWPGLK